MHPVYGLSDLPAGGSRTVGLSVRVFGGASAPPHGLGRRVFYLRCLRPRHGQIPARHTRSAPAVLMRPGTSCQKIQPMSAAKMTVLYV